MASVLIVDDEDVLLRSIARYLGRRGHRTVCARTPQEALSLYREHPADLCVIDYRLGRHDGLELLRELRSRGAGTKIVMVTGYGDVDVAVRAMKCGADDFLVKPVQLGTLASIAASCGSEAREGDDRTGVAAILGHSAITSEIRTQLRRILEATRELSGRLPPVLVTGESGVGKELVARALHHDGARANGPFVSVNCAALPSELIESELFGHVKGAFTDARTTKRGLFEAADGGVLFLDEIGDMSLAAQAKLLRVLETQSLRPVGAVDDRPIDIWIVAATNQSLDRLVAQERFRADLMYRLQVLWIDVPPLRERDADIPLLADHFLRALSHRYGNTGVPRRLSPAARAALLEHCWPGNVRELRNTIERAALLAGSDTIEPADLRLSEPERRDDVIDGNARLEDVEVSMLRNALRRADGNVSRAATLLGITRDTMRYRMDKFGLSRKP